MNGSIPIDSLDDALLGPSSEEYGKEHQQHLLEIYKLYVEMADRISARRERANAFFLAVNTAVIALLSSNTLRQNREQSTLVTLAPIAGIAICYLWYRIIRSYRNLNSAKFRVIHRIEQHLPLRPYDAEWESVGRGKDPKRYLPFTQVELAIPWIFICLYVILIAVMALYEFVSASVGHVG